MSQAVNFTSLLQQQAQTNGEQSRALTHALSVIDALEKRIRDGDAPLQYEMKTSPQIGVPTLTNAVSKIADRAMQDTLRDMSPQTLAKQPHNVIAQIVGCIEAYMETTCLWTDKPNKCQWIIAQCNSAHEGNITITWDADLPPLAIEINDVRSVQLTYNIEEWVLKQSDLWRNNERDGQIKIGNRWYRTPDVLGIQRIGPNSNNRHEPNLVGQIGIFAKKDIPSDTVIGEYTGVYGLEQEFERRYSHTTKYAQHVAYLYGVQTKSGTNIHIDARAILPSDQDNWIQKEQELQYAMMAIINDGHQNVRRYDDPAPAVNSRFTNIHVNRFPQAIAITTKRIRRGQQLFVEYGKRFWTHMSRYEERERVIRHNRERDIASIES